MKSVVLCAVLLLLHVVFATSPSDWAHVKRASPEETHTVAFALKPKAGATEEGDRILNAIHDSKSERYGRHLEVSEIEKIFIDFEALRKVEAFLTSHNIQFRTRGDFIWATASIATLDQLLNAEFHHFEHNNYPTTIYRTKHYTIPHEISQEVAIVFQTTDFPPAHEKLKRISSLSPSEIAVDPTVLRKIYNVPNVGITNTNQSHGVLGANGGFFDSDLVAFFSRYGTTSVGNIAIVSYQKYNASICAKIDCGEPTLDMQYIMSMAPGVFTIFFNSIQDAFADSFNWLATEGGTPQSFSASLGVTGAGSDYQSRLCTEAQKASLRGTTLFAASGDGAGFDSSCHIYDTFPCACPYITAVGGTQGPENNQAEVVWDHSGAGASGTFPLPDWQRSAAQNYFARAANLPQFTHSQRVYPDIAGVASILPLIQNGKLEYAAGTSFASPAFAGIYSQINVRRQQAGKSPIGFLNSLLYQLNGAGHNPLRDITQGSSKGSCNNNLPAIVGWDMGTGWGSADFNSLTAYLA